MKNKRRKQVPQPPRWAWLDLDNCYFCKNKNNCGRCKVMKNYAATERRKQTKKNRQFDFLKKIMI